MKLKQFPDDFRVEELINTPITSDGPFAIYRLTKINWTTIDALQRVGRKWKIDPRQLSYGGLKDRHAHTIQHFTIPGGPARNLRDSGIEVEHLGRVADAFRSTDIQANRFTIVLRDLSPEQADIAVQRLAEIAVVGVPNYFDDQRFGSVGDDGEFIARLMIREEYDAALKLALAGPYAFDKAAVKREKALLREHWGDWPRLKAELPRGHARNLVEYLVFNPTDRQGALARLQPELRTLYLAAYQSHLWNRMLATWLTLNVPGEQLAMIRLRMGQHPVPKSLAEPALVTWRGLQLPLPSGRLAWDDAAQWAPALRPVLDEEHMELADIKLRGFRHPFFSKGDREASVIPSAVSHAIDNDDKHARRKKLLLAFELPRGSYATMIVKRVTA